MVKQKEGWGGALTVNVSRARTAISANSQERRKLLLSTCRRTRGASSRHRHRCCHLPCASARSGQPGPCTPLLNARGRAACQGLELRQPAPADPPHTAPWQ